MEVPEEEILSSGLKAVAESPDIVEATEETPEIVLKDNEDADEKVSSTADNHEDSLVDKELDQESSEEPKLPENHKENGVNGEIEEHEIAQYNDAIPEIEITSSCSNTVVGKHEETEVVDEMVGENNDLDISSTRLNTSLTNIVAEAIGAEDIEDFVPPTTDDDSSSLDQHNESGSTIGYLGPESALSSQDEQDIEDNDEAQIEEMTECALCCTECLKKEANEVYSDDSLPISSTSKREIFGGLAVLEVDSARVKHICLSCYKLLEDYESWKQQLKVLRSAIRSKCMFNLVEEEEVGVVLEDDQEHDVIGNGVEEGQCEIFYKRR